MNINDELLQRKTSDLLVPDPRIYTPVSSVMVPFTASLFKFNCSRITPSFSV